MKLVTVSCSQSSSLPIQRNQALHLPIFLIHLNLILTVPLIIVSNPQFFWDGLPSQQDGVLLQTGSVCWGTELVSLPFTSGGKNVATCLILRLRGWGTGTAVQHVESF